MDNDIKAEKRIQELVILCKEGKLPFELLVSLAGSRLTKESLDEIEKSISYNKTEAVTTSHAVTPKKKKRRK